ncbi:MAG: tetratricopeptide repeat protein [Magnetococcales bacterium]|nr:tetratricopeptide repeat protein [Magnetococcales bacterium]
MAQVSGTKEQRVWQLLHQTVAAYQQQDLPTALRCCDQLMQLDNSRADAWSLRGVLLVNAGRLAEAESAYLRAIELQPGFVDAWFNLGNLYLRQKLYDRALERYQHCLVLDPRYASAYEQMGQLYVDVNQPGKALQFLQQAVSLRPDSASLYNNLGKLFWEGGNSEQGASLFRRAVQLAPQHAGFHDNLLIILHFLPSQTAETLLTEHRLWAERHIKALIPAQFSHANDPNPDRLLRIGYLSSTFIVRDAAGASLFPLLTSHDRSRYQVYCYATLPREDDLTATLKGCCHWRQVDGLTDQALFELIQRDGIDILIDANGHTMANKLSVLARRAAPVQVTWLGYEGTTGLSSIDYIVSDWNLSPMGSDGTYTEQVMRMPYGYACYAPATDAPDVSVRLPALINGYVTFASFNKLSKLNRSVAVLWSEILKRVPESRLLLKWKLAEDEMAQNYIGQLFADAGIGRDRLIFRGQSPYNEMMQQYNEVDIALDPFPFSGGATTCDALWMGVPVVTLLGQRHASNHTVSHLRSVGLPELIATTPQHYIDTVVALASDLDRQQRLRTALRPLMQASPLCNGRLFALHFERLLRDMWGNWCRHHS